MSGHRPPGTQGRYTWTRPVSTYAEIERAAIEKVTARYLREGDIDRLEADLTVAITDPRRVLTPEPPPCQPDYRRTR